jgi:hypothetical protein
MAIKSGMVLAGIARFGWSFSTSLSDGWEMGVHLSDTLEGSCVGKLNAIEEDGAVHSKPIKRSMRGVFGDINVRCFNGLTEFGFKHASVVGLEQLIPAVEPLVDFAGNFPAQGRLPGSMDVPVDGGVALRPYGEELSPDGGEHCS